MKVLPNKKGVSGIIMTAIHQESLLTRHKFAIANAVQEQRIRLNMTQLMGCDYIFIAPDLAAELFIPEHLGANLGEIIQLLEANPRQSLIILVDNDRRFTRIEYSWNQGNL